MTMNGTLPERSGHIPSITVSSSNSITLVLAVVPDYGRHYPLKLGICIHVSIFFCKSSTLVPFDYERHSPWWHKEYICILQVHKADSTVRAQTPCHAMRTIATTNFTQSSPSTARHQRPHSLPAPPHSSPTPPSSSPSTSPHSA